MHISLQHYTTHVKAVLLACQYENNHSYMCYFFIPLCKWSVSFGIHWWVPDLNWLFCVTHRSSSLEPEGTPSSKSKPRERIIPIHVERDADESSTVSSPPAAKPSIQGQRSMSHRYCPQTYAYTQQHSVTLLWSSSYMKVVSCINIWYPIQIHCRIWIFVTVNSLNTEGERHLFLIGRKIHSVYAFLAIFFFP